MARHDDFDFSDVRIDPVDDAILARDDVAKSGIGKLGKDPAGTHTCGVTSSYLRLASDLLTCPPRFKCLLRR